MQFEDALSLMRSGKFLCCKEFKSIYRLTGEKFEFVFVSHYGKWWKELRGFSPHEILSNTWEIYVA